MCAVWALGIHLSNPLPELNKPEPREGEMTGPRAHSSVNLSFHIMCQTKKVYRDRKAQLTHVPWDICTWQVLKSFPFLNSEIFSFFMSKMGVVIMPTSLGPGNPGMFLTPSSEHWRPSPMNIQLPVLIHRAPL